MKRLVAFSLTLALAFSALPLNFTISIAAATNATYDNLLAAVQGETQANANYTAFAAQARSEGYAAVARLFLATADAEAKHAADEWAILLTMGATVHPVAATPVVRSTAENLKAAFDGETYEYTTMYPGFLATAQAEAQTAAAKIFNYARQAEQVHAGNYNDVLTNLANASYINSTYATVYRCPVCGEVVTSVPNRCPICGTSGSLFVIYNETYFNLLASVQGETNANANYTAFADEARSEGYAAVARLFLATADAEYKHAADEWAVLQTMNITTAHPVAVTPVVRSTAENLKAAFDGETYEYTTMYPGFLATAQAESQTAAAKIFNYARQAEQVHAGNYNDVLTNLANTSYINTTYATVYRCPVCGEVVTSVPNRCPICGTSGSLFVIYNETYFNLLASVQGETQANANYTAFAARARADGSPVISQLFLATADAEYKHAADEWAVLRTMNITTDHPVAATPVVGTTAENLKAAFDGETYEYTTMYPGFLATAQAEAQTAAAKIFNYARQAEQVHAGNYNDVLTHLADMSYVNSKYITVFRCPVCGEVVTSVPNRCPICGTSGTLFVTYSYEPTAVSVKASASTVKKGTTIQLVSSITPADTPDNAISWSSSNDAVATVNANGVVTGVKTGTVRINATTANGITYMFLLMVTA